jgi:predicted nucleic acid-binding protein
VIYLDSSVVLAYLLAEPRTLPDSVWANQLVSSRLLEYEVWNRIHLGRLAETQAHNVRSTLDRISLIDLTRPALARALEPFPIRVRTLDALHLASVEHLRSQHESVQLASYDERMLAVARALQIPIFDA